MTFAEKVAAYREKNLSVVPGQILFAGSSLMEQFPSDKLLKEAGYTGITYNRGIGGYKIDDLRETLGVCILDLKPRRLFLNIGTNDLTDPALSDDDVMDNYDRLLSEIESALPSTEIYLMAYYPVNPDAASGWGVEATRIRSNERINRVNPRVKAMAEKHGHHYIDVNNAMKDEQGRLRAEYTVEGIHIVEEGYRAIIPALLPYLE